TIDPPTFVVFETGTAGEVAMKVRNPGLALIKNWTAENGSTGDVQHYFGKTLGLLEEAVGLKACDRSQSIDWIGFSYCNDIVRYGIETDGCTASQALMQADGSLTIHGDWKCHFDQHHAPAGADINQRNDESRNIT